MEDEILMNFGIRKVRGRQDSVTLTLPPAWVKDQGLAPIGRCFVQVCMDTRKRLILTPMDIIDDAVPVKRQRKSEEVLESDNTEMEQSYSEENQEENNEYPDTSYMS
jgi:hypothetical protein